MDAIFGKDGLLSRLLGDYEYRPVQVAMAREVQAAIAEMRASIIEADTGTGKTLAYLVPAVLGQRKTVISTGTKTLQDQLLQQDIPFLRKHLPQPFRVVCMKGRANYLCLYRLQRILMQPELMPGEEESFIKYLVDWAQETSSGDRAEIDQLPDDFAGWGLVSAREDQCVGQKCPRFDDCFLTRMRREAAEAEIVVVNHHLFFADLAVRSGGYGQVIPPYEVALFDEAHLLEETASHYFGIQVSSYRVFELFRDISWEMTAARSKDRSLVQFLVSLGSLCTEFFEGFTASQRRTRFHVKGFSNEFKQRWFEVGELLEQLTSELFHRRDLSEGLWSCHRRCREISQALDLMLHQPDQNYVYWYETRGKGRFLWASPVHVASLLEELLFKQPRAYIFTSATLAVSNDLSFFKNRLGLPNETTGMVLDTTFTYREQAVIYVPKNLASPDSSRFLTEITDEISAILVQTEGRAFVLFTSHRNMREVYERLAERSRFTLLLQGEQPKPALLNRFREDTGSVLLGTTSFWQGVDMPGETLSCVIIDKLPFAAPDDPLVAVRMEKIAEAGGNPFWEYQVPSAVLALRQGLGRLIRRATDRGILAILDARLYRRGYGRVFLESLPESVITHRREDIATFLGTQRQSAEGGLLLTEKS
ncbi:MAG: ATP-dependent DNA helicase [Deltaproteobacteria bacterium]|nr:MAG: ATP-dependent DNA helicase [Deltaproteobacteria bacterium]